jgi:hypothetical protein
MHIERQLILEGVVADLAQREGPQLRQRAHRASQVRLKREKTLLESLSNG